MSESEQKKPLSLADVLKVQGIYNGLSRYIRVFWDATQDGLIISPNFVHGTSPGTLGNGVRGLPRPWQDGYILIVSAAVALAASNEILHRMLYVCEDWENRGWDHGRQVLVSSLKWAHNKEVAPCFVEIIERGRN